MQAKAATQQHHISRSSTYNVICCVLLCCMWVHSMVLCCTVHPIPSDSQISYSCCYEAALCCATSEDTNSICKCSTGRYESAFIIIYIIYDAIEYNAFALFNDKPGNHKSLYGNKLRISYALPCSNFSVVGMLVILLLCIMLIVPLCACSARCLS